MIQLRPEALCPCNQLARPAPAVLGHLALSGSGKEDAVEYGPERNVETNYPIKPARAAALLCSVVLNFGRVRQSVLPG